MLYNWNMLFATLLAVVTLGLGEFSADVRARLESRIRGVLEADKRVCSVSGTVTGVGESCFFIQQDDEALKVGAELGRLPEPGDVVVVEGAPSLEGGRVLISALRWAKTGTAALPSPKPAGGDDLLDPAPCGINWLRVEVEGRAIELTPHGFALDADGLPISVQASSVPSFIRDCGHTRPRVRATGVAELILDQSVLFGRTPYVMGVKLQLNSADDVVLLPDAQYLVNVRDRRMMFAVAGAFVLLGVGLVLLAIVIVRQKKRSFKTHTLMAERKRMADDIHDTIEQHLVGAGMLIQLNRNKEAREILLRAKSELRDIVWGLKNDDMMRLTPTEMLRELAETEIKKGIFRVTVKLEGLPETMPSAAMRDLSLIVREAIGNAVKHGQAKNIAIVSDPAEGGPGLRSRRGEGGWLLRIANDGAPFDAAKAQGAADGHFGLEGMRERARRIGAELSIEVAKNNWTVVTVRKK